MATLTHSTVPEHLKPVFKSAGITFKRYGSAASLERDLAQFIGRNQVLHLGTCGGSAPRVTPVMYKAHRMIFYVLTEGGGKLANLKKNKKVCFAIAEPYDSQKDILGYKGLQAWGTARVYSLRHEPEQFREALRKMNAAKNRKKIQIEHLPPQYHYRLIEIVPDIIKYGNPREGIFQVTWKRR